VGRVDLDAVRTFAAAADAGQFQEAAVTLSITQQAVSKRIAALEKDLNVRLFTRTARGAQLTVDGQTFLPHARELLRVAERADASVRPGRRALRVDVVNRRVAPAVLLQDFYRMHPEIDLPRQQVPDTIRTAPVIEEPHQLLVGPRHALAHAHAVTPAQLAGHRIWMPGLDRGTEVAVYYRELAAAFGLTIDMIGPVFGNEALLAEIADSAELATLVGERSRYLWPDSYDLRRVPVRGPALIYPMSLIWRDDNPHPVLARLREYLEFRRAGSADREGWMPTWARCW
jgi:DNA-binding transcriptional LysR family regulator